MALGSSPANYEAFIATKIGKTATITDCYVDQKQRIVVSSTAAMQYQTTPTCASSVFTPLAPAAIAWNSNGRYFVGGPGGTFQYIVSERGVFAYTSSGSTHYFYPWD